MAAPEGRLADSTPRNVWPELQQLLVALDLDPKLVRSVYIRPTVARVEVYQTRNGRKFLEDGEPAIDLVSIPLDLRKWS